MCECAVRVCPNSSRNEIKNGFVSGSRCANLKRCFPKTTTVAAQLILLDSICLRFVPMAGERRPWTSEWQKMNSKSVAIEQKTLRRMYALVVCSRRTRLAIQMQTSVFSFWILLGLDASTVRMKLLRCSGTFGQPSAHTIGVFTANKKIPCTLMGLCCSLVWSSAVCACDSLRLCLYRQKRVLACCLTWNVCASRFSHTSCFVALCVRRSRCLHQ